PAVPHLVADLRDGVLTLRGSISEAALAAIRPVAELIYAPDLVVEVETDVDPAPWEALMGSLISVLPITGDAELVVLDGEVRLVGTALDERRRAQLIGAAASILGDAMSLEADVAVTGLRAPSFGAVASPDGTIVLEGEVPDAEIAATIVAFAADAYGAENVTDSIGVSSDVARTFSPFRIPYIFHSLRAISEWNITIDDDAISGNLRGGATFGVASARLTPELESLLDIAAGILLRNPGVGAIIEGHTDSRGRADDNLGLSEDRALAAARYLEARGVAPQRLTAVGYGETSPIADNSTAEGRAENRRIEFVLAPVQQ
ncbi:MAG: OmpA family protein, partial [Acidimicrobiia bacterium]|nr:OmpA family protein [Acidimicrobiia bacterium]